TSWPPSRGVRAGSLVRQISVARGQRVWKGQPLGLRVALGMSSLVALKLWRLRGSRDGAERIRSSVYGWSGVAKMVFFGAISTILPRYITATRCEMNSTTPRSWEMDR